MSDHGWGPLINSRKWHYFEKDGKSLCGKWFTFDKEFEQGNDHSRDNCSGCVKKLEKRKPTPSPAAQSETPEEATGK